MSETENKEILVGKELELVVWVLQKAVDNQWFRPASLQTETLQKAVRALQPHYQIWNREQDDFSKPDFECDREADVRDILATTRNFYAVDDRGNILESWDGEWQIEGRDFT